jgi:hypothetical protein
MDSYDTGSRSLAKSASVYIIAEKISVVKSVEGNNIHTWLSKAVWKEATRIRKSLPIGVMERLQLLRSFTVDQVMRCYPDPKGFKTNTVYLRTTTKAVRPFTRRNQTRS